MAAERVEEASLGSWGSRRELRDHLLCGAAERPLVFRGGLKGDGWADLRARSPAELCHLLGERETSFKVCPLRGSERHRQLFADTETVFETRCLHVRATFTNLAGWLSPPLPAVACSRAAMTEPTLKKAKTEPQPTPHASSNPLLAYPRNSHWIYADYKYMAQLCEDLPRVMAEVDWGIFGFDGRSGADSTLWVGSEGAYTPCHYDTYGCNLVAQVWGRKKWTLFSPSDSACLYPTRVPYEESSVFSEVNVACPDLERHRDFTNATRHEVVLEAGDALFVPSKWWHYVECVEDSVSINTWISLPSDDRERVKEAIVRAIVTGWPPPGAGGKRSESDTDSDSDNHWINPNEEAFTHDVNLELLSMTLAKCQAMPTQKPHPLHIVSHYDWMNALASEKVVEALTTELLSRHNRNCSFSH